jgi:DNA-binding response OmpR family regulator
VATADRDFDVALVDVRLPDGDGLSLLEPLRVSSPLIEVVLITGDASPESAMAAVRAGAFAYVLKPISPRDLIDTVRRAAARLPSAGNANACAGSWSAPSSGTASWSNRCRRTSRRWTKRGESGPGTGNSSRRLAAVGTMAAGLAHEVRNPLNSAALQLSVLERRLEKTGDGESTRPIVGIMRSEIERLERLVREFLKFAQPRPLAPEVVGVAELLEGVVTLIRPEAEAANIVVVIKATPARCGPVPATRASPSRCHAPAPKPGRQEGPRKRCRPRRRQRNSCAQLFLNAGNWRGTPLAHPSSTMASSTRREEMVDATIRTTKRILLAAALGLGTMSAGWVLAETPPPAPKAKAAAHDHDHDASGSAQGAKRTSGGEMGMGGGGTMMGGGMMGGGMCPMMAGGEVKVDVKNVEKGVTVTWTATDPAKVARLQKWAAGMRLMHEAMSP